MVHLGVLTNDIFDNRDSHVNMWVYGEGKAEIEPHATFIHNQDY